MVSPNAVNFQISLGLAFLGKPGLGEKPAGGCVLWNAGRLEPVEAKSAKGEEGQGADSAQGLALPRKRPAAPVAHGSHLGDATTDVGEGDAPRQNVIFLPEDEKE